MQLWLVALVTLLFSISIHLLSKRRRKSRLPPGPVAVPFLGNLLWLRHSLADVETLLRDLHRKHGPIVTLRFGSRPPAIFISDRKIAHKVLVEHGAAFSDRPPPLPATRFVSSNQRNISSGAYGPLWRLLRRNLMSEILHSSRVKLYSHGRDWVLGVLSSHLHAQSRSSEDGSVVARDSFQFAMFCLLVLMCFGEKLDEKAIREIETAQRGLLLCVRKLNVLQFFPAVTKHIYRNRWRTAVELRRRQTEIFLPLIKARKEHKETTRGQPEEERFVYSYLDSLLDIKLQEGGGRGLTEGEMVSLCSEFLTAGTDTTSTALQWIMAELVKNPDVQRRLFEEIDNSSSVGGAPVREEQLQKLAYLKAVVLEGLRRHPPVHFVLPHAVSEEVEIEGYVVPKRATVNFMVADMGWDRRVWEEPMEFRPERFLAGGSVDVGGVGVDITGSREIKMMPFGAGRRICPGLGLAMLHLEFFVANLVREFEWTAAEGHEVDLSEKPEFTTIMKYPLRARLLPRRTKQLIASNLSFFS